jgi:hypothetical protein
VVVAAQRLLEGKKLAAADSLKGNVVRSVVRKILVMLEFE